MTVGQALTLLVMAAAISLFGVGLFASYQLVWNDAFYHQLVGDGWKIDESNRSVLGAVGVFMSLGAALALVQAQQGILGWFLKKELERLQAQFRDIEMVLGTDAAERVMAHKVERMQAEVAASPRLLTRIFG